MAEKSVLSSELEIEFNVCKYYVMHAGNYNHMCFKKIMILFEVC